jgi:hypothetical protein
MKYMLFVGVDPDGEELEEDNVEAWVTDLDRRGKRVIGDRLRPAEDATTVRVRKGELLVTDGPFTESKDWIVGFDVLDCDDLDEAIEIASAHPMARAGRLELRPFWPFEARESASGPAGGDLRTDRSI